MNKKKVVCVNELTIRFEQLENENAVNWFIVPDHDVDKTQNFSVEELAGFGAPLSVLGIRELWELCLKGAIFNALETANTTKNAVLERTQKSLSLEHETEGVSLH